MALPKRVNQSAIWVARRRGGLCNNLKCLLSTMRLAQRDYSSFPIYTNCPQLAGIFTNLNYIADNEITDEMKTHRDWRFIVFEDDEIEIGFSSKKESRGFPDADPNGRNIDYEYERIPRTVRDTYLRLIDKLVVHDRLMGEIERFEMTYLPDNTISMHMRTWLTDNWDKAPKRHQRYFDIKNYEEAIEQHQQVFICSDNSGSLNKLKKRFGDKLIYYPENKNLNHSQIAFIELALLAKSNIIYGSSLSTFTEMAWWLGGCQAEVRLFGANSVLGS